MGSRGHVFTHRGAAFPDPAFGPQGRAALVLKPRASFIPACAGREAESETAELVPETGGGSALGSDLGRCSWSLLEAFVAWPAAKRGEAKGEACLVLQEQLGAETGPRGRDGSWPCHWGLGGGGREAHAARVGPGVRPSAVRESVKWAVRSHPSRLPTAWPQAEGFCGEAGKSRA